MTHTVNKFGVARASPPVAAGNNDRTAHAVRVHEQMFRAIELLGRKLERSENERERLAQRLSLIESSAEVDEKTGKIYLPARIETMALPVAPVPRWHMVSTVMSSALAILALVVVLFQKQPNDLTPQQIATINKMMSLQLAQLEREPALQAWRPLHDEDPVFAEAATPNLVVAQAIEKPPAFVIAKKGQIGPFAMVITPPAEAVPAPVAVAVKNPHEVFIPGEDDSADTAEQVAAPATEQSEVEAEKEIAIKSDTKLPPRLAELEKRAFDGIPEAQHDLAAIYASGGETSQDYKRAAYWFFKAADGGIANAHYNLGVMFQQGLGVKKDLSKALRWYESAARLGHPEALYNLGIAYVEGIGGVRDLDRGVAYFKKAANAGVSQAAFNLGVLYESGFIGPINRSKALEWYRVAADGNHEDAQVAVTRLEAQMRVAGGAAPADAEDIDNVEPAAGQYGEGDASSPEDERKVSN